MLPYNYLAEKASKRDESLRADENGYVLNIHAMIAHRLQSYLVQPIVALV
jgi:hypothetical protein